MRLIMLFFGKFMKKCDWCIGNELNEIYHDTEWGKPIYDSKLLFQKFCLDSFQAGLSWLTILKKRDNFNPHMMINYDDAKITELIQNAGIVRHKGKILATINNAYCYLNLEKQMSFSDYLWGFVDNKPIKNHFNSMSELPAQTELSVKISKDLKKRGFKFCGATIIYAFMQAVGMVNDHLTTCFLYEKNIIPPKDKP
jgi:DNA-3-methyladenine glycosylase I